MSSLQQAGTAVGNFLDDNLGTIAGIGGAWAIGDSMRRSGDSANKQMQDLATQLSQDSAFKGYGVTSGLGQSNVDASGNVNLGVGPDEFYRQQARDRQMQGGQALNRSGDLYQQGATNALTGQAQNMLTNAGQMGAYNNAMSLQNQATSGLGGQQAGALNASQQAMRNAMQSTAGREQDIYNRAMAMQNPLLDQQQAAQQAREFAQGRSGIAGSQFGGTAEDAAMARARAQASNQASFQAMGQAQQEMMNQASMANQFGGLGQGAAGLLGNIGQGIGNLGQAQQTFGLNQANALQSMGNQNAMLQQQAAQGLSQNANIAGNLANQAFQNQYGDMQNQMALLELGGQAADRYQTGQLTGTGYGAQLGLGGIQAEINADKAASELYGNTLVGLMNAQAANNAAKAGAGGGLFGSAGGWLGGVIDSII
jgi:hypothetical protein